MPGLLKLRPVAAAPPGTPRPVTISGYSDESTVTNVRYSAYLRARGRIAPTQFLRSTSSGEKK
jgi:hypothetical protein